MSNKNKPRTRPVSTEGKLPPQAIEVEEAILGGLLLDGLPALEMVSTIIGSPDVFYKPGHGSIYTAMMAMYAAKQPVDIITVVQQLKSTGELEQVGGAFYISQLTNRPTPIYSLDFHCRIVVQKWLAREMITKCGELMAEAYADDGGDVFDLYDDAISSLMNTQDGAISQSKQSAKPVAAIVKESVEQYNIRAEKGGMLIGIGTGTRGVDLITNGWQAPDLIILAARPAMGKTAYALQAAKAAAKSTGKPVAVFSLEMSSVQLVNRLLVEDSGIDSEAFKRGQLGNGEIRAMWDARDRIADLKILIDDTPAISIEQFARVARRLKKEQDIQLIVVDYLQLMRAKINERGNREQEISAISRGLKAVAKELNVPVIALSQLSRECEKRADKRPILSDLRESGAIEQDADLVIFLHRPEYYGLDYEDGESSAGVAEIIISKHRGGATGTVKVKFIAAQTKFEDFQPEPMQYNSAAGLTPNTNFYKPNKDVEDLPF